MEMVEKGHETLPSLSWQGHGNKHIHSSMRAFPEQASVTAFSSSVPRAPAISLRQCEESEAVVDRKLKEMGVGRDRAEATKDVCGQELEPVEAELSCGFRVALILSPVAAGASRDSKAEIPHRFPVR